MGRAKSEIGPDVLNGKAPLAESIEEGEYVVCPIRSGGPFDPAGPRGLDVCRLDDLVAMVGLLGGEGFLVTLTVDRRLWTCPEAAYQRVKDKVRRVAREVAKDGVWFGAFEVQTKTGDGWPHWHLWVWASPGMTAAEAKRLVEAGWRVRTESVDQETGEVRSSVERIGFVDVQAAKDSEAVGIYVAKYLTKRWEAVPAWMGDKHGFFKKVRAPDKVYEILERMHRHERQRGGRTPPATPRRRARRLYDRMASSCTRSNVFVKRDGRLKWVRTFPLAFEDRTRDYLYENASLLEGVTAIRLGNYGTMRLVVSAEGLQRLGRHRRELRRLADQKYRDRLAEVRNAWHWMQAERREVEAARL